MLGFSLIVEKSKAMATTEEASQKDTGRERQWSERGRELENEWIDVSQKDGRKRRRRETKAAII